MKLNGNGDKVWDKTFGGSLGDNLWAMQQTAEGGYILGGESSSGIGFDKTQNCRGIWDFWVVKLDTNGEKIWDRTFGGSDDDELFSLQQTQDGGFILGGWSMSGQDGDKTEPNRGYAFIRSADYWVIKIDANGNKIWDKTFGGNGNDFLYSINVTADGGYILGGYSESGLSGEKSQLSNGGKDYWVIKIDSNGNKLWDKAFGGSGDDELQVLKQISDGGYVLGGWSNSGIGTDKSQPSKGGFDFWVIKVDSSGQKLWDITLGGNADERLYALQETSDKGFILGGWTESGQSGDVSQPSRGSIDFWVVKIIEPCRTLNAAILPVCKDGSTTLSVSVSGIQPDSSGLPSWTLTYQENGLRKTLKGASSTFDIARNAVPGSVFTLEKIVSGACITNLSESITVQKLPDAPKVLAGNNCGVKNISLEATGAPIGGGYALYNSVTDKVPLNASGTGNLTTENLFVNHTYYVAAFNNAGCEGPITPVYISYESCPEPFIPNIITPNNDNLNDRFKPLYLPGQKWIIQIFNRWGTRIYETQDYQNTWPETAVPTGTYYYRLLNQATGQEFKGWLEVVK